MKPFGSLWVLVMLVTLVGFAQPTYAQENTQSATAQSKPLEVFISNPAVNPSSTSVYIAEIGSGRILAQHNADVPLMGASTMKLVTVASLLRYRDVSYRYATKVETAGRVVNGVLEGNLHIISSGDPTLNSDRTPKSNEFISEIIAALNRQGIKSIAGQVQVDQTVFDGPSCPESWSASDKGMDYGAGAFGFNYSRNHIGNKSVSNPAAVFLAALEKAFANSGIEYLKKGYTGGGRRLILTHYSAPLDEIMRSCMVRSDNLYAECLMRQVAIAKGRKGSVQAGTEEITALWTRNKAPMQGVRILDGSGLSRSDRLTGRFLAYVLRSGSTDPYYASFFPLAGVEGTLSGFLKGTRLQAYIAMKTGSLHDVQAYAGYKLNDDYVPTHIVVVLANNFRQSRAAYRAAVEKLILGYL